MAEVKVLTIQNGTHTQAADGDTVRTGGLQNTGLRKVNRKESATDYVVLATDHQVWITDTSVARSVYLESAATAGADREIVVLDKSGVAGTNNITVVPDGTDTISGAASYVISTNYGAVTLVCDGSNWFVVAKVV